MSTAESKVVICLGVICAGFMMFGISLSRDTHLYGAIANDNLLLNGDFSDGSNFWAAGEEGNVDTSSGSLCVTVPTGTVNSWDAQIAQNGFLLQAGRTYKLTFDMQANTDVMINVIAGETQEPYGQYYLTSIPLTSTSQHFHYQFVMPPVDDANSLFVMHIGATAATRFCLDNVSLSLMTVEPTPVPAATAIPDGSSPKVIFDDFSYSSNLLEEESEGVENSIFGSNLWMTENGEISSRFWRRYNWGDLSLDPNASVEPSAEGMTLVARLGLDTNNDREPAIFSGLAFPNHGAGTYHARIRFDDLENNVKAIQAFWAFALNQYKFVGENYDPTQVSPIYLPINNPHYYASETDIEWNNWFRDDNISRLAVANHRGSDPFAGSFVAEGSTLQCLYRDAGGSTTSYPDCVDSLENNSLIANRWLNAMFVINDTTKTVAYSMWINNWDALGGTLWIGGPVDNPEWGEPLVISRYYPTTPMVAVFSQTFFPGNSVQLTQDHELGVDYFYYSSRTDLTNMAVEADIARMRSEGLARVNTTGLSFQEDRSLELSVKGPGIVEFDKTAQWTVTGSLIGTRFDVLYRYRLHEPQGWSAWHIASTLDVVLVADGTFDQIELEATAWNFWNKEQFASASRVVHIVERSEKLWLPVVGQ